MLRAKCNVGVVFLDETGFVLYMFNMWLVLNRISNLISIPCLIRNGYRVTFDSLKAWFVHCPDGGVLKLKTDVGTCKGFPYIDLKNPEDHIVTNDKSETFKEKLNQPLKATRDISKKSAYALVQTVQKNMEGFTKKYLQGAYLARKAQLVLSHPPDKTSAEMVCGISGVANIPSFSHDLANVNYI